MYIFMRSSGDVRTFRRGHKPRSFRLSIGFTLLEVVFAAAVMVMAITTSITAMQRAFNALDYARKVTLAGQIMQSELERMRLVSWSDLTNATEYPPSRDITSIATSAFGSSAAIMGTLSVTRQIGDVTGRVDMKQITLIATWTTYDGRSHSRSYTTYYGKNGLYDYFYNSY